MADKAIIVLENVGGFIFDISGTVQHTLESDITDHYVEDNTAIQDHWALKPEKIVLKNYQGEVASSQVLPKDKVIIPKKLTENVIIKNKATGQTYQLRAKITKKTNDDKTKKETKPTQKQLEQGKNKQKSAYEFFKSLRASRTLVSCTTIYGDFTNMAIENIVPFQDEDTRYMSSFTITLKEIKFAQDKFVAFDKTKYQSVAQNEPADNSKSQGKSIPWFNNPFSSESQDAFKKYVEDIIKNEIFK